MKWACIALLAIVLLSGCSSERMDGISDKAYEYGIAALETIDEFIAGEITADSAKSKLDSVEILADACTGDNDGLVSSNIFFAKTAISAKDRGTGTMSEVEEKRDSLAELLGR